MNVSELLGKPVLDLSTATTVGRIDDVVLDVPGRRLHGLRVGKSTSAGEWLAWDDIKAVGSDAVTIDAFDRVGAIPAELPGCWLRGDKALGGRVLSDGGRELGSLTDIDLDAESGALQSVVLGDRRLEADSLQGIGTYATVVRDPADR